jgi:group I intron endonuclease
MIIRQLKLKLNKTQEKQLEEWLWVLTGVYRITHRDSGKTYIGQAVNFYKRMACHRSKRSKCPKISNAIKKYGGDAFDVTILEIINIAELSPEKARIELSKAEQRWLDEERQNGHAEFNIALVAGNRLGVSHTEETKLKMSLSRIGIPHSEEWSKKIGIANIGKVISDEQRIKISEKLTGRHPSDETLAKLSESHMGHIVSEETREKLRIAHLGKRKHTEESKQVIGEYSKNRHIPCSEETKRKISETLKRTWHEKRESHNDRDVNAALNVLHAGAGIALGIQESAAILPAEIQQ